jgi:Serine phosphatase RsbU, regulator of sigma subunit
MTLERAQHHLPPAGVVARSLIPQAAGVVVIALLSWFALATRPEGSTATAWWPASGIAVGMAIHLPRRRMWWLAAIVGLVVLATRLGQVTEPHLAVTGSFAVAMEIVIAHLILRVKDDQVPTLRSRSDLGRLLIATFAAASAFDLIQTITALLLGDPGSAVMQLMSAGPRHAAGILLVAPLFLTMPEEAPTESGLGIATHATVTLGTALLVFLSPLHLPLAFLPIVPLVWGSLQIPIRWLLIEMLMIAGIASFGSVNNVGPFTFDLFGPAAGSAILQIFELSMVGIVLVLALTALREREASAVIGDSELLYRRNFESSLAGALIVVREADCWQIRSHNRAADDLFPRLDEASGRLCTLLGRSATDAITAIADVHREGEVDVRVIDGRHFHASVAPLDLGTDEDCFSIQLLDITDSLRARRLIEADLNRAHQVQQALSPGQLPLRRGWAHGASAVTATEIGGDFYDLQINGSRAVMMLGDVMGKGIGAGILAAVTRTALRAANEHARPAEALADAARVVDADLAGAKAFVTLAYASVDLLSGQARVVDAGHGLSFVVRADRSVERVAGTDFPIGFGVAWKELGVSLAEGDALLMVSDGVLDAWGTTIEELIARITALAPERWQGQADDFTARLCAGPDAAERRIDDATALVLCRESEPK